MEAFDVLCQEPLWNSTVSWDTDNPNLSACFRKTILLWIPASIFWTFGCFKIIRVLRCDHTADHTSNPAKWTILQKLRVGVVIISIAAVLAEAIATFSDVGFRPVDYLYFGLLTVTLTFNVLQSVIFIRHKICNPAVQFFFWLFLTVTFVPTLKSAIDNSDDLASIYSLIQFSCFGLTFLLSMLTDTPSSSLASEINSSFAARLCFSWTDNLFIKGRRGDAIDRQDFPEITEALWLDKIVAAFDRAWCAGGKRKRLCHKFKAEDEDEGRSIKGTRGLNKLGCRSCGTIPEQKLSRSKRYGGVGFRLKETRSQ